MGVQLNVPHFVIMQATLDMLRDFDSSAAESIASVLKLSEKDFVVLLENDECPLTMSRKQYIQYAIDEILVNNVHWQFDALAQVRILSR